MNEVQDVPVFEIRRLSGWRLVDLRELWTYRELVYFLTWRDVKVRYKQTLIGVLWALLQPAAMTVVFALLFGRLANVPSGGIPYPLFAIVGLLPWQFFSRTLSESTNSLVTDQRLITRVYFPRIIVPIATNMAALMDFLLAGVLVVALMIFYGATPGIGLLWLPAYVALMVMTALGVGFWLSALNVEYRDVMYTIPFLTQFWFFITPVVYPTDLLPAGWQTFYGLNPMASVVEGFRSALLGIEAPSTVMILSSTVSAVVLFVTGIVWFRQRERSFVDVIGSGGR